MPKLLANIKKLNERKKELIKEKKFEKERKKLYLNENRILKADAVDNAFKSYICNYHKDDRVKPSEEEFLKFKNNFYK